MEDGKKTLDKIASMHGHRHAEFLVDKGEFESFIYVRCVFAGGEPPPICERYWAIGQEICVYLDNNCADICDAYLSKLVSLSQLAGFPGIWLDKATGTLHDILYVVPDEKPDIECIWHKGESFEELMIRVDLDS